MANGNSTGPTVSAFVFSFVADTVLFLALVTVFLIIRKQPSLRWLYDARRSLQSRNPTSPPPPEQNITSWFKWLPQLIAVDNHQLRQTSGLDSVMFIEWLRLSAVMFALFALLSLVILLPIYVTAEYAGKLSGFNKLSIGSVSQGSPRLIATLIIGIVGYLIAIALIYVHFMRFLKVLHLHFKDAVYSHNLLSLQVILPEAEQSEQLLRELSWFSFGENDVHSVYLPVQTKDLEHIIDCRRTAIINLEWLLLQKRSEEQNDKSFHPTLFSWRHFKFVDALEYWQNELNLLNAKVNELLDMKPSPLGCVGFITLKSASIVRSAFMQGYIKDESGKKYSVSLAPICQDIYWPNIGIYGWHRRVRDWIVFCATGALIIFYTIPLTAIQALANISVFEKWLPGLASILNSSSVLRGLVQGFLPSLAMILFMLIIPVILRWLTIFEGQQSYSRIEHGLFKKYFMFEFFSFYLIPIFASTALARLDAIASNPTDVPTIFGESLPSAAYLFTDYLMLRTSLTLLLELLNLNSVIIGSWKRRTAKSEEEKKRASIPQQFTFGSIFPMHLLAFIIAVGFAFIQPILLIFATVYFALAVVINKYQVLYTATPMYDSSGQYYVQAIRAMLLGLIIGQLTLIGILGLKESGVAAGLMVLPLTATVLFTMFFVYRLEPRALYLTQRECEEVDSILRNQDRIIELERKNPNLERYSNVTVSPYFQRVLCAARDILPFSGNESVGLEHKDLLLLGDATRLDCHSTYNKTDNERLTALSLVMPSFSSDERNGMPPSDFNRNSVTHVDQSNRNYDIPLNGNKLQHEGLQSHHSKAPVRSSEHSRLM